MKYISLSVLCLYMNLACVAQSNEVKPLKKWRISKLSLSVSRNMEQINHDNHEYFVSMAHEDLSDIVKGLNFDGHTLHPDNWNTHTVRAGVTIESALLKRLAFNINVYHTGNYYEKYSYLDSYKSTNGCRESTRCDYFGFTSGGNELGLDFSIQKYFPLKWVTFYGGIGTNAGFTYDNFLSMGGTQSFMRINEGVDPIIIHAGDEPYEGFTNLFNWDYYYDSIRLKNGFRQRFFLEAGLSVTLLQRLEIGGFYRKGIGYQAVSGTSMESMSHSTQTLTVNWKFN